jgi:glyoxylase-like metal-dependent hydrolase (beta-lactamase superfamily II)
MARKPTRQREIGRGERVLPGVWRLRLPLPWPGVPHCNAWALAAGDGIVLVDTGMHEPGSLAHLETALSQCNLTLDRIRLIVCTHAHSDHAGQAPVIAEKTGAEVWMHPNHAHFTAQAADPEAALARRIEVARQSGVPKEPLERWAETRRGQGMGVAGELRVDRDLLPGVTIETDLGPWEVVETPGHAPSHVVLHQPERRTLISGDHLLGRVSLYYDYGYTPDPVGEFLDSLDRVAALDVRLALSGHGRPFTDIEAHIKGNRDRVAERLSAVRAGLKGGEKSAYDLAPVVYGEWFMETTAQWLMTKLLCYLTHLEQLGEVRRIAGDPERWATV